MRRKFVITLWSILASIVCFVGVVVFLIWNGIIGYMPDMEDLQNQLVYYSAGEEVTLTIQHPMEGGEYKEREIKVTLSKRSDISSSSSGDNGQQRPGQESAPSQEDNSGIFTLPFGF